MLAICMEIPRHAIIIAMNAEQAYLFCLLGCKQYTIMHNFEIPKLSQSMIAYYIFGYYYITIMILRISWNPGPKPHSADSLTCALCWLRKHIVSKSQYTKTEQSCSILFQSNVRIFCSKQNSNSSNDF